MIYINKFRAILKGIKRCGIKFFWYNFFSGNLERKSGYYFYPYRNSILVFGSGAKLVLNGNFEFNANKYKGSKAESYLVLDEGARVTINGNSRINYGSTLHFNKNSVGEIGSMTANVGLNIQCFEHIIIGEDCMFGRNAAIFDSSFHPTGVSKESMIINNEPVVIGNHVWIGAYVFIMQGAKLGDGCIVGANAYIRGEYAPAATIMVDSSRPSSTGVMWARSMREADINCLGRFYNLNTGLEPSEKAIELYYDSIYKLLQNQFPQIDFKTEKKLLEDHILDSLSTMQVVGLLSDKFDIEIPYFEISATNFNSIESMATLVFKLLDSSLTRNDTSDKGDFSNYVYTNDNYEVLPQNTLIEYVKVHAEKNPNKFAVISGGRGYSYAELYKDVQKYASFLQLRGLKKGNIVVVKSIQSIDYIIIYLAVHYCGGVITTVEKSTNSDKINEIAAKVSAQLIVCDSDDGINVDKYIYIDSKDVGINVMGMNMAKEQFPKGTDSADILFTTGTTGDSKGVELSHIAVIAGAENIAYGCEMKRDTVLVVPNPLSHSNAIKNLGACLITGCTFYVLDGLADLSTYFNALDYKYGRVATVLPPAAIRTIFQLAKDKLASYIDKLDYLMAATAPLPEPDRETLRMFLPKTRLYNHYGCSESSSICIYDFNKYSELKNCVGKAMPHSQVFFVDDNKCVINSSAENIGLLAVRGDAAMKGYFNEPDLTDEILIDNIIYTRDIGYIDENGFVFILGRNDDIINVGGLKVSPLDVESVALAYKDIQDCICISEKDSITGQALKLLVVADSNFNLQEFQKYISSKLDSYKVPKKYELVKKIERTYNGKLNRKFYNSDK